MDTNSCRCADALPKLAGLTFFFSGCLAFCRLSSFSRGRQRWLSRRKGRLFKPGGLIILHMATVFKICAYKSVLYKDKIDEQISTFMPEACREPKSE